MGVVSAAPFQTELPAQFGSLKNKHNAVFGILECVYLLHGAELRKKSGELCKLDHQIEFSDHFFEEFVLTVDKLGWSTPLPANEFSLEYHERFRILALAYESLAYQRNGHCKYPPPHTLELEKYFNTLS